MISRTKKTLLFALLVCTLTVAGFVFLIFEIKNIGTKLNVYTVALNEKSAREESSIKINRLTKESATTRAILASAFFSDEGSSVSFLNDLETFATSIGLEFKTDDLDKIQNEDKTESIKMTFIYTGSKDTVLTFTKFLEEIPYHSTITDFAFKQNGPNTWEGKLTLLISLTPS